MYLPKHFAETDVGVMHDLMQAYPLATLVSHGPDGLSANHIPLQLDTTAGPNGTLRGHIARANPLSKASAVDGETLLIFRGPESYISPSAYATKAEHGKVVPTWNYIVVQASGHLVQKDGDPAWLRAQLDALTHSQEGKRPAPWQVSDAPEDYIAQTMKAIVGIEISIRSLTGKWKVSQNQPAANREGVVRGLTEHPHGLTDAAAVALAVRDRSPAQT